MNYYDLPPAEREARGLDYDLCACLQYNAQAGFTWEDIARVVAVVTGQNDGQPWHWVLQLKKPRTFVYLEGGCDYTGWDCQSWAHSRFATTARKAAKLALGQPLTREQQQQRMTVLGLGQLVQLLLGAYDQDRVEIYAQLLAQIKTAKRITWRQMKDKEFKL